MKTKYPLQGLVGRSPAIEKLRILVSRVAESSHPALIVGETGTGKELAARCIHLSSPLLASKSFIPIRCASPSALLAEGDLSVCRPDALGPAADDATIFLDNVDKLSLELQAKLVQAIEQIEVGANGHTAPLRFRRRFLAATTCDMEDAVQRGRFRRDLYFRLSLFTLRIPPLRERREDIAVLAEHILNRIANGTDARRVMSPDALDLLQTYSWPGNVRELESCIEQAWLNCSSSSILVSDLPAALLRHLTETQELAPAFGHHSVTPVAELERQAILHALYAFDGDTVEAARRLGMGRSTLYRKIKRIRSGAEISALA